MVDPMAIDTQEHSSIEVGSSRSFGLVFATVFALIGLLPLVSEGSVRLWSLIIAGVFFLIAIIVPHILQPLNLLWFKFGLLLGRIVNPIVMLLIYIIAILPIGLILRLFGKDLLLRKFDSSQSSYWIVREPAGPEPKSLEEQF
jgi:saxitoxin biosynthesis operon SxtJ-like protein